MRKSSKLRRRKNEFINSIIIIFVSIIIAAQIKDKLFPLIKRVAFNQHSSSEYVLADSNSVVSNETSENNESIKKEEFLKDTIYIDKEGKRIIKNPNDILVLVNKERNLTSEYKPSDLVIPNIKFSFKGEDQKKFLRKEAAKALEELFKEGEKESINLCAVSGYRSYSRQDLLFNNKVKKVGFEAANKLVARPGQSEHQTGLAMDVSSDGVNYSLEEVFEQTAEGKWLKENAHKFGFIIRYPNEKVDITGYSYEPWHIRYVGKQVAAEIYEGNITLEEYLGFKYNQNNSK